MQLTFGSIEEVRDFVKNHLKGSRGGKDKEDGDTNTGGTTSAAPPPMQPPQGNASFAPPQQPSFQPPAGPVAGFPGAGQPGIDPNVAALVARINTRIDGAIQSGQPADTVLTWFRSQCGAEAANATMDQIKQNFLPKLPMPSLENIAKLMNA